MNCCFSDYPHSGQIVKWLGRPQPCVEDVTAIEMDRTALEFARAIMYGLLLDTKTQAFGEHGEHTIRGQTSPLKDDGEFILHFRRATQEDGKVLYRAQFWFPKEQAVPA